MTRWEYVAINLNDVPVKLGEMALCNQLGEDGWELVAITENHIAYLKRKIEEPVSRQRRTSKRVPVATVVGD